MYCVFLLRSIVARSYMLSAGVCGDWIVLLNGKIGLRRGFGAALEVDF